MGDLKKRDTTKFTKRFQLQKGLASKVTKSSKQRQLQHQYQKQSKQALPTIDNIVREQKSDKDELNKNREAYRNLRQMKKNIEIEKYHFKNETLTTKEKKRLKEKRNAAIMEQNCRMIQILEKTSGNILSSLATKKINQKFKNIRTNGKAGYFISDFTVTAKNRDFEEDSIPLRSKNNSKKYFENKILVQKNAKMNKKKMPKCSTKLKMYRKDWRKHKCNTRNFYDTKSQRKPPANYRNHNRKSKFVKRCKRKTLNKVRLLPNLAHTKAYRVKSSINSGELQKRTHGPQVLSPYETTVNPQEILMLKRSYQIQSEIGSSLACSPWEISLFDYSIAETNYAVTEGIRIYGTRNNRIDQLENFTAKAEVFIPMRDLQKICKNIAIFEAASQSIDLLKNRGKNIRLSHIYQTRKLEETLRRAIGNKLLPMITFAASKGETRIYELPEAESEEASFEFKLRTNGCPWHAYDKYVDAAVLIQRNFYRFNNSFQKQKHQAIYIPKVYPSQMIDSPNKIVTEESTHKLASRIQRCVRRRIAQKNIYTNTDRQVKRDYTKNRNLHGQVLLPIKKTSQRKDQHVDKVSLDKKISFNSSVTNYYTTVCKIQSIARRWIFLNKARQGRGDAMQRIDQSRLSFVTNEQQTKFLHNTWNCSARIIQRELSYYIQKKKNDQLKQRSAGIIIVRVIRQYVKQTKQLEHTSALKIQRMIQHHVRVMRHTELKLRSSFIIQRTIERYLRQKKKRMIEVNSAYMIQRLIQQYVMHKKKDKLIHRSARIIQRTIKDRIRRKKVSVLKNMSSFVIQKIMKNYIRHIKTTKLEQKSAFIIQRKIKCYLEYINNERRKQEITLSKDNITRMNVQLLRSRLTEKQEEVKKNEKDMLSYFNLYSTSQSKFKRKRIYNEEVCNWTNQQKYVNDTIPIKNVDLENSNVYLKISSDAAIRETTAMLDAALDYISAFLNIEVPLKEGCN